MPLWLGTIFFVNAHLFWGADVAYLTLKSLAVEGAITQPCKLGLFGANMMVPGISKGILRAEHESDVIVFVFEKKKGFKALKIAFFAIFEKF